MPASGLQMMFSITYSDQSMKPLALDSITSLEVSTSKRILEIGGVDRQLIGQ
jgi:hypothetical protein